MHLFFIIGFLVVFAVWAYIYFVRSIDFDNHLLNTSCGYDCYDDGGCPNCSVFIEWEDRDYGTVGQWFKFSEIDEADKLQISVIQYAGIDKWDGFVKAGC